LSQSTWT